MYGSILIYGDGGLVFKNNSTINVDYSRYPRIPPGFEGYGQPPLAIVAGSYTEP